jgi:hypothetical protein
LLVRHGDAMDPFEKLDRIAQLKTETDEHRANIAERQAAREANPLAYDDYLRQREAPARDLVFKKRDDALAPVAADNADDAENQKGWDLWIRRHLDIERKGLIAAIEQDVGDVAARLRAEFKGEIAKLEEARVTREQAQAEKTAALVEVRKELVLERNARERTQLEAALAQRDARIGALEERLSMLARFLSLQGLEPPKGVV